MTCYLNLGVSATQEYSLLPGGNKPHLYTMFEEGESRMTSAQEGLVTSHITFLQSFINSSSKQKLTRNPSCGRHHQSWDLLNWKCKIRTSSPVLIKSFQASVSSYIRVRLPQWFLRASNFVSRKYSAIHGETFSVVATGLSRGDWLHRLRLVDKGQCCCQALYNEHKEHSP